MIKPIMSNPIFTGVKRKDIIKTVNENKVIRDDVIQAKINATYEFINGKLTMVASDNTDIYLQKEKEYEEWLNEEIGND